MVDVLGDGNVRVAAGSLKLVVPSSDLRSAAPIEPIAARPMTRSGSSRDARTDAGTGAVPIQTRDNTCDLRGLRVDDGVGMAMTFIDRAIGSGQPVVFLLHGHGTGAMRDALRKELARSPCVARFRGADADGGGEGVTLAWLT